MVVTKSQRKAMAKEQLKYVIEEVMDEDTDSNLHNALTYNNCDSFVKLMGLSLERIEALNFRNTQGKLVELKIFEKSTLELFLKYCDKCITEGNPLRTTDDIKRLNYDDFCEFRITYNLPSSTPSITTSNPSIKPSTPSALRDFLKGTKRDMTLFPILKDAAKWDSFEREFEAVARSQNLQKVLDENYVPTTVDESELFEEMNAYLYAVFVKNLKIDDGQALVRTHQKDKNAQAIYTELKTKMTSSTTAEISSDDLLEYILTSCFNNVKWKGTAHGYILNWLE